MHVVILSDGETRGGAAIGTSRLALGLIKNGVRVTRLVHHPDRLTHPWVTVPLRGSLREQILWRIEQRISKRISIHLALYTQRLWFHHILQRILEEHKPDVISVNNLHGAGWWPHIVTVCTRYAPTVWTLRDMWSFTGRCAYNYGCRKFLTGCDDSCPTSDEYPVLEPGLIDGAWKLRYRILSEHPELVAVCPSRWLAQEAFSGLWKSHRVEVIPNGLPLDVYRPLDKKFARAALDINTPGPVLLVSAHHFRERRKGGSILGEALQGVSHRPFTVITMGQGELPVNSPEIHVHHLGFIDNERMKTIVYNAADLVVHPAPMDNLPHVVMEAIACGTPVVGFPIGGVVDMVRPNKTGWLATEVSSEALAKAMTIAIQDLLSGIDFRHTCREVAETEYGDKIQAYRYVELFRSMSISRDI